jgi:hypothetical protein
MRLGADAHLRCGRDSTPAHCILVRVPCNYRDPGLLQARLLRVAQPCCAIPWLTFRPISLQLSAWARRAVRLFKSSTTAADFGPATLFA